MYPATVKCFVCRGKLYVSSQYSGAIFTTDVVWAGSAHNTEFSYFFSVSSVLWALPAHTYGLW